MVGISEKDYWSAGQSEQKNTENDEGVGGL